MRPEALSSSPPRISRGRARLGFLAAAVALGWGCRWRVFARAFIANGATTTLRFDNTVGVAKGGVLLDAIKVRAQ
jgi:hypothetical protein